MKPVITAINDLIQTASALEQESLVAELAALHDQVTDNDLYVAVTGIFKRGKSSLINAILQEEVLPVGVIPVTSIITLIRHDPYRSVLVSYTDGNQYRDDLRNLHLYVSEAENPDNNKRIDHVTVFHPAKILEAISLVDTPGTGSAFEHNTAATLAFIPRIDAALFVLSADMPVSAMDITLLQQLQPVCQRIILVLNKADLRTKEELAQIISHNRKVLAPILEAGNTLPEMAVVSARAFFSGAGDPSGLPELQKMLDVEIIWHKTGLVQSSSLRKIESYRQQLDSLLDLRITYLLAPREELEKKRDQYKQMEDLLQNGQGTFNALMQHHLQELDHWVEDQVKAAFAEMEKGTKAAIEQSRTAAFGLLREEHPSALQEDINRLILSRSEELQNTLEKQVREKFHAILLHYIQQSRSFLQTVAQTLPAFLDIGIEAIASRFDLNVYSSSYITLNGLEKPIAFKGGPLSLLISNRTKERKWVDQLTRRYHELLVTNMASVCYDIQYRIQESFRKFDGDLKSQLRRLFSILEKEIGLVTRQRDQAAEALQATLHQLHREKEKLNQFNT